MELLASLIFSLYFCSAKGYRAMLGSNPRTYGKGSSRNADVVAVIATILLGKLYI